MCSKMHLLENVILYAGPQMISWVFGMCKLSFDLVIIDLSVSGAPVTLLKFVPCLTFVN